MYGFLQFKLIEWDASTKLLELGGLGSSWWERSAFFYHACFFPLSLFHSVQLVCGRSGLTAKNRHKGIMVTEKIYPSPSSFTLMA